MKVGQYKGKNPIESFTKGSFKDTRQREPYKPKVDNYYYDIKQDSETIINLLKQNNIYDIQKYIIDYNISLQEIDDDNNTILHKILLEQDLNDDDKYELIKFCLERGSGVNSKNIYGITPLHLSAKYYYNDIFDLLLKKGADINITDNQLRTPLHYALMGHEIDCPEKEHKYDIIPEEGVNIDKETVALADGIIKKLIDEPVFNKYLYHIKNTIMNSNEMFFNDLNPIIEKTNQDMDGIITNLNKSDDQKKKEINDLIFGLNNDFRKVLEGKLKETLKNLDIRSGMENGYNPIGDNKEENKIMKYDDIKNYYANMQDNINKNFENKFGNIDKIFQESYMHIDKINELKQRNINVFLNEIIWIFLGGFLNNNTPDGTQNTYEKPKNIGGYYASDFDKFKQEFKNVIIDTDTTPRIKSNIYRNGNIDSTDFTIYNIDNIVEDKSPKITKLTKQEIKHIEELNKKRDKKRQLVINKRLSITVDNAIITEGQNIKNAYDSINNSYNVINSYSEDMNGANEMKNFVIDIKNKFNAGGQVVFNDLFNKIIDDMYLINNILNYIATGNGNRGPRPFPIVAIADVYNIMHTREYLTKLKNINDVEFIKKYKNFIDQFQVKSIRKKDLEKIKNNISTHFNVTNNDIIVNTGRQINISNIDPTGINYTSNATPYGANAVNLKNYFPKYSADDDIFKLVFKYKLQTLYIADNTDKAGLGEIKNIYDKIDAILKIYDDHPSIRGYDIDKPENVLKNPNGNPEEDTNPLPTVTKTDILNNITSTETVINSKINYYIDAIYKLNDNTTLMALLENNVMKLNSDITSIDFYKIIIQLVYDIINVCINIHIIEEELKNFKTHIDNIINFFESIPKENKANVPKKYSHYFYIELAKEKSHEIYDIIVSFIEKKISNKIYNNFISILKNINDLIKIHNKKNALIVIKNYNNKFTDKFANFYEPNITIADITNIFYKNIPYIEVLPEFDIFSLIFKDGFTIKEKKQIYELYVPQVTKNSYTLELIYNATTKNINESRIGYLKYTDTGFSLYASSEPYSPGFNYINQQLLLKYGDDNKGEDKFLSKPIIQKNVVINNHIGKIGKIYNIAKEKKESIIPIVSELIDNHFFIIKYLLIQNLYKSYNTILANYENIDFDSIDIYKNFKEKTKKIFSIDADYPLLMTIAKTADKILIEFITNHINLFSAENSKKIILGKLKSNNYQKIYELVVGSTDKQLIPEKKNFKLSLIEIINNIINPLTNTDFSLYTNILTRKVQTKKIKIDNDNIYVVNEYSLFNLSSDNICYLINKNVINKILENKFLQIKKDINGNTPIYYAIDRNNIEIIKHFVQKKPDCLKNVSNKIGLTPLEYSTNILMNHLKVLPENNNYLINFVDPMFNSVKQNILSNTVINGRMITNSSLVFPFLIFFINKYFHSYMLEYPNGWTFNQRNELEKLLKNISIETKFDVLDNIQYEMKNDRQIRELKDINNKNNNKQLKKDIENMEESFKKEKENMEKYSSIMDQYKSNIDYEKEIDKFDVTVNLLEYIKSVKEDINESNDCFLHSKINLYLKGSNSQNFKEMDNVNIDDLIINVYDAILLPKINDYINGEWVYDKEKNDVLYDMINITIKVLRFTLITSYYHTIIKTLTIYFKSITTNYNDNSTNYSNYLELVVKKIMLSTISSQDNLYKYIINDMPIKLVKKIFDIYENDEDFDKKILIEEIYNQVTKILILNRIYTFDKDSTIIKEIKEKLNPFYQEYISLFLKNMKILMDGYIKYINIEAGLVKIVKYIKNNQ